MHRRKLVLDLLRASAAGCMLLAGPALLTGCGGAEEGGQMEPEDPAKAAARAKTMEDYMKSPEGKKSAKPGK